MTPTNLDDFRAMFRIAGAQQGATPQAPAQQEGDGQQEEAESSPPVPALTPALILAANSARAKTSITEAIDYIEGTLRGDAAAFITLGDDIFDAIKDSSALRGRVRQLLESPHVASPTHSRAPKITPRPAKSGARRRAPKGEGKGTPIEFTGTWMRTGREPEYHGGKGIEYASSFGRATAPELFDQVVTSHGEAVADFDTLTLTWVDWKNVQPPTVTGTVKGTSDGFKWADSKKRVLKVGIKPSRGGIKVA